MHFVRGTQLDKNYRLSSEKVNVFYHDLVVFFLVDMPFLRIRRERLLKNKGWEKPQMEYHKLETAT